MARSASSTTRIARQSSSLYSSRRCLIAGSRDGAHWWNHSIDAAPDGSVSRHEYPRYFASVLIAKSVVGHSASRRYLVRSCFE